MDEGESLRPPGRIRRDIEKLEKQFDEGRIFPGRGEEKFFAKMKKLLQELKDSEEEWKKKAADAGFDGRTGIAAHREMRAADFRQISSEEFYERWNQKRKLEEEEANRRGFDSVEAMREADIRQWERMEFLEENSCPACKNQIPCDCGLVDSDNISRNALMGSHF